MHYSYKNNKFVSHTTSPSGSRLAVIIILKGIIALDVLKTLTNNDVTYDKVMIAGWTVNTEQNRYTGQDGFMRTKY